MAGVVRYHGNAAALQAARAYGEPLANFFPQTSRLITAHFAWIAPYRPRACENALQLIVARFLKNPKIII